jgi:hypothetical protein
VLNWNTAFIAPSALSTANFQLATVPKNRKQHAKSVGISRVIYSPGSTSITIVTAKLLNLSTALTLTIDASSLLTAAGNPVNSNDPGHNVVILLTRSGARIQSD